ncbi:multicopper oxidase domain-containing protein [Mycolicibacter virginiensis]|uniref:Copper-containing nitrite reductase n=1 Tax=Mycolicibacter virginiensis TaxID=1795032 RepID=A0A9X7IPM2_9MYCO|nr:MULTISPECIES: multicopper oxidase domain-containing protein [Mycobacteriaceae]PQM53042.1 copper oxidase [Mycolicibacter virginiensis]ULP48952.1 multicopper oxidase domain-containing protein [Mycolicibacter virginiensis]
MIQLGPPPPAPVVKPRRRGGPRGPVFLGANIVVLGWLALAVALLVAHNVVAHPIWLPVHALLLGAATNAIVIWSGHFTTTLCRVPDPPQWHLVAKLALLNLAVIATLAGVAFNTEALTGMGGTAVAVVAVAHGAELIAMKKRALSARFDYLVGFYLAAIAALLAGSATGAAMAFGVARWYARLWTTHVHVMLYGWIGLTVVGTLFTLWPTTIREKITPRSFAMARRALPTLTVGLTVAAAGLLTDSWWLTAAGLLGYAVGVGLSIVGLWPGRSFTGPAAWMLVGATAWLGVAVMTETIRLIAARSVDVLPAFVENTLLPLLAVGFVAQILLGALSQLLPILVANGPPVRKAVISYLDQGWQARVCAINIAVPLVAGPWRAPLPLIGWVLAAVAVASFVLLALRLALPVALRGPLDVDAIAPHSRAVTGAVAAAAVAAVAAALGLGVGGSAPSGAAGVSGEARTVDVTLKNMRFSPDVINVPAGTRLVLRVTNIDGLPHDLHVDTGEHTPRLSRGQTAMLDLGAVHQDREAWCDVPGHRAAGMTMTIHAVGGAPRHEHTGGGHGGLPAPTVLDLAADPSPGWTPRDAVLAPAKPGVHRVELRAVDRELEIAPGRRETRWTFGGVEPAPTLHGRVGDTFEITLINDATMGHGIDFHAGALAPDQPMRTLAPGERLVYRFTAHRAGAWLYHCSTPPMALHIANGMYGAVIIDPPGLPAVDREYALVGAQLYASAPDSDAQTTAIRAGQPDGWMFNGTAAQYMHAPLPARTGERVRVWVVNAGPGDSIAFHVVGTQFDTVYKEGAWLLRPGGSARLDGGGARLGPPHEPSDPLAPAGGAQALDLAPAQGGFVELTFPEPGHYPFMDHDMRHAENGAHGIFAVTG